jgi:hypothetical protein
VVWPLKGILLDGFSQEDSGPQHSFDKIHHRTFHLADHRALSLDIAVAAWFYCSLHHLVRCCSLRRMSVFVWIVVSRLMKGFFSARFGWNVFTRIVAFYVGIGINVTPNRKIASSLLFFFLT